MNPEETCYIEPSHRHGFGSNSLYKYGERVKIVANEQPYLDWTEGLVIRAETDCRTTRYKVRCFSNREELWRVRISDLSVIKSRIKPESYPTFLVN